MADFKGETVHLYISVGNLFKECQNAFNRNLLYHPVFTGT